MGKVSIESQQYAFTHFRFLDPIAILALTPCPRPCSFSVRWGVKISLVKMLTVMMLIVASQQSSSYATHTHPRQGPRLSIRIDIWILPSDTETSAATP